jgi:thiamine pyrophosphate-dependent acetolactate synthase large subunit-like protein
MSPRPGRFALVEQLVADGARYLFGNPGTVEQGFLDAVQAQGGIEYVLALQESVAVGMADGYARATGRPTFVQLHSSVGLGNGMGMLYQAFRGGSPLVVLSGDAGLAYDAMDAQMACDLAAMARPVTKWSTRVTDPRSLLRVLRRAVKIAATPPTGPTFVGLPMDVLDAPNDEPAVPTSFPSLRAAPEPSAIAALARLLAAAERPLLLIGDGIARSGAQPELTRLAERLGALVWGVNSSEVNIDATHPLYRGLTGHMFGKDSTAAVGGADAVLIVGTYVFPEVFPALGAVFRPGARVAHVDLAAEQIAKSFPVELGLVADPKLTLAALVEALEGTMTAAQSDAARKRARDAQAEAEERRRRELEADARLRDAVPMQGISALAEALSRRLPADAIVFDEALTAGEELGRYLPGRRPGQLFQTRGGSLGVGIPGGLGIKLAHPDRPVVVFTGDGASMYTIQALWTAVRHDLDVKMVVCNNGRYHLLDRNIDEYWRERGIERHPYPGPFDLGHPPLRFVEMARSYGVPAARIDRPGQIHPVLDEAFATAGPFLIDLVFTQAT